ncbi:MAG: nicotinate phosphoribosyltransferase [Acidobacteria bacterium]|nr:MAG: nicotinate phosphoribosyltransferase [Acidobacteriota bacterium]
MKLNPLFPTTDTLGVNTDLYELTMAAAYFEAGCTEKQATFELFTRRLPTNRSFLVAAGLEQALHFILNVTFSDPTLVYLKSLPIFQRVEQGFFDYLKNFRFSGDVYALPEGTICFSHEPLLQVKGPVIEAQILETLLINTLNFQTMVASKAARLSLAARQRQVFDFGMRRAHSPQAGVEAARAAFIGGCAGTSNVLAGFETGIPVVGTMAHSFVQFFERESEAFAHFQAVFPDHTIFLVDTYDTLEAVEKVVKLGGKISGVRLDSGNLQDLAVKTRELLDRSGRKDIRIFASGNLDEGKIHALTLGDVPIDGFGVGTDLVVSSDAPSCEMVYKLVEVFEAGRARPRMKTSHSKSTTPFRKQVYRRLTRAAFAGDVICRWDEVPPAGRDTEYQPLLAQYVKAGELCRDLPDIRAIKAYAQKQLDSLPTAHKLLHSSQEYPVKFSRDLIKAREELGGSLTADS